MGAAALAAVQRDHSFSRFITRLEQLHRKVASGFGDRLR
jgi:hypothetical protein